MEELGDILFFIHDLCNIYGWTVHELIYKNREKLEKRYPNGEWTPQRAKDRADKQKPPRGGGLLSSSDATPVEQILLYFEILMRILPELLSDELKAMKGETDGNDS
jgi:hypothetical protein